MGYLGPLEHAGTAGGPGIHPAAYPYLTAESLGNDSSKIKQIIECPKEIDPNVWQYEHVRQFILELNLLVTTLKDICTK